MTSTSFKDFRAHKIFNEHPENKVYLFQIERFKSLWCLNKAKFDQSWLQVRAGGF